MAIAPSARIPPPPALLAFYIAVRDDVRAGNTEEAIDRIEREFGLQA